MAAEKHAESDSPEASNLVSIVIDFFAVLVPGAILAYVASPVGNFVRKELALPGITGTPKDG